MNAEVDAGALAAAIESERRRFVDFLRRRVGDEAEDLFQHSLLRALERAGELSDPSLVKPWFWRLLRNSVTDHHRARVARDSRHAALRALEEGTPDEETAACACALGLLSRLPPDYAEILRRVDLDDERVIDVARSLGITSDNAAVRLHRARAALRAKLSGCCAVQSLRACFSCDCATA